MPRPDAEPAPLEGTIAFEPSDFEALAPAHARDPEWNDRRLNARRRLAALGRRAVALARGADAPGAGAAFEVRSSLHHPHAFNGGVVRRLWTYLVRPKAERTRLRRVLGPELGKDLDSAFRNAYLCLALEHDRLEVSLRLHPDAWYDGQNLVNRVKREGLGGWRERLNELDGFQLRLHDWKGEWRCGALEPEALEEFLRFYTPGEHQLVVDRRWPVPPDPAARAAAGAPEVANELVHELLRLVPLYRYTAWSAESDHLFSS